MGMGHEEKLTCNQEWVDIMHREISINSQNVYRYETKLFWNPRLSQNCVVPSKTNSGLTRKYKELLEGNPRTNQKQQEKLKHQWN
jgi:hypothetical protein